MIYIKGNVPSSKNSKQWTGRHLVNSKTVNRYLKEYGNQWKDKELISKFHKMLNNKEKPYEIGFYFIRDSKRRFDYINAAQLPCDLMVKYGWITDDNCNEIVPVFLGYEVDKDNQGVIVTVR